MAYSNPQPPEGINVETTGWVRDFALLVVGFFGGLLLLLWLILQLLGWGAKWIPFAWESALADPWIKQQDTHPQRQYLQSLAESLAQAGGLDERLTIQIHLVEDTGVNAFATLGGHIFILRGLLDTLESEQGLAFVIAHEIAHVHHRHPIKSFTQHLGFAAFLGLLIGQADLSHLLSFSGQLLQLDYSRDYERESDAWAIEALSRHYGHLQGADEFFRWAHNDALLAPLWLSTHPDTHSRLHKLHSAAADLPLGEATPLPRFDTAQAAETNP